MSEWKEGGAPGSLEEGPASVSFLPSTHLLLGPSDGGTRRHSLGRADVL